jgi:hypothetical protein
MMPKIKVILTMFIAVLVVGGMTSASASAAMAGWMVNGTLLSSGSESMATTALTQDAWELNGGGLSIKCTGSLNAAKPEIKAPNKFFATSLTFTLCETSTPNCTVPSQITTLTVLGEVTLEGALAAQTKFTPEAGTLLATVKFTGEKCAEEGLKPITGKAAGKLSTGQDERTPQRLEIDTTEASGELFVGGSAASLKGAANLKLQDGQSWSFL